MQCYWVCYPHMWAWKDLYLPPKNRCRPPGDLCATTHPHVYCCIARRQHVPMPFSWLFDLQVTNQLQKSHMAAFSRWTSLHAATAVLQIGVLCSPMAKTKGCKG